MNKLIQSFSKHIKLSITLFNFSHFSPIHNSFFFPPSSLFNKFTHPNIDSELVLHNKIAIQSSNTISIVFMIQRRKKFSLFVRNRQNEKQSKKVFQQKKLSLSLIMFLLYLIVRYLTAK